MASSSLRTSPHRAYLDERLKRFADAERGFDEASRSYDRPPELIGFYYRARINTTRRYRSRLDERLARVFPNSLVSVSTISTMPATGVIVTKDSELSRAAGPQAAISSSDQKAGALKTCRSTTPSMRSSRPTP
jgi:hypothetical protein